MLNGVDLWSGLGGVSSGWLESSLIKPLLSVECNPIFPGLSSAYESAHKDNFPNGKFLKLSVEEWAKQGFPGVQKDTIFISHGSPPCQHFTQATRGQINRPLEDESDYLGAMTYADFLEYCLPPYFTLEQVIGYEKSYSFKHFFNRVSWFYNVQIHRINLKHYGLPQNRLRLFVTGNRFLNKPLTLPPYKEHRGWISTLSGLTLRSTVLTKKQQLVAVQRGFKTLLLPRIQGFDFTTAKRSFEPYPTILRSVFTDQKNNNRYEPFSCLINGLPYAIPLRAIARAQGFFDTFKLPRFPVIAGSGIGNAFASQFVHDFIVHNFGKK